MQTVLSLSSQLLAFLQKLCDDFCILHVEGEYPLNIRMGLAGFHLYMEEMRFLLQNYQFNTKNIFIYKVLTGSVNVFSRRVNMGYYFHTFKETSQRFLQPLLCFLGLLAVMFSSIMESHPVLDTDNSWFQYGF